MSARYYPTAKSGERLGPPLPSYSAAREWHAQSVMCGASAEGRVVLLDLSSLPLDDETAWKRLLNDDPVIAAIFHMGFALGYDEGRQR